MRQKILIIDDSESIHQLVKVRLKHDAVDIISAPDGETGISLSSTAAPDLILLDVDMPGFDGFETCRRLKANPATSHIPVCFLTSEATVDHKVRGFALGAADYVTKPFNSNELRARVQASLNEKKRRDLISSKGVIDDLTSIWNKTYFEHRQRVEVAQMRRFNRSLSCIVFDIDNLSAINAAFTYAGGDDVLRAAAGRAQESSRAEDTVCHIEGGKFAILIPNADEPHAMKFAGRLWLSIPSRPLFRGELTINFKCSFGVATQNPKDNEDVYDQAHRAMLRAKEAGGARIATIPSTTAIPPENPPALAAVA